MMTLPRSFSGSTTCLLLILLLSFSQHCAVVAAAAAESTQFHLRKQQQQAQPPTPPQPEKESTQAATISPPQADRSLLFYGTLACRKGLKLLPFNTCVCNQETLESAVASASTSAARPTRIKFCPGSTLELTSDIDITNKAIEFTCAGELLNDILGQMNNDDNDDSSSRAFQRRPCIVSGGGITRHFTGAPVLATFRGITFQSGNGINADILRGGVFYFTGGMIRVTQCVFENNRAESGGAISIEGSSTIMTIDSSMFTGNTGDAGGAIYFFRGAQLNLLSTMFLGNEAKSGAGGALYCDSSSAIITNSTFARNEASIVSASGGAIFVVKSQVEIDRTVFIGNKAGETGTAGDDIFISDNLEPDSVDDNGSFVECDRVNPVIFCDGIARVVEFGGAPPSNTDCATTGSEDPGDGQCDFLSVFSGK